MGTDSHDNDAASTTRLPTHVTRELAVLAQTDPRTILSVHRDPSRASANAPCARAARVLRERGYLPNTSNTSSKIP